MDAWMSKHIIVKSSEFQKRIYVDPAGIDGKLFTLPRENLPDYMLIKEIQQRS